MARVAIVGVGAIGGVLAGLLQTTGRHEITLCTRRPLGKLTVQTPQGVLEVDSKDITDPAAADTADWVLVATKAYHAGAASPWFRHLCRSDTPVAVFQNGVEHRERFAPYVNPENIVPVIIDCPAERLEDGTVLQRSAADIQMEDNLVGNGLAALFQGSKAQVRLTHDFATVAWRKLCVNSAGAISALVLKPAGVLRDEDLGQVALEIIRECAAVGRAEGAHFEEGIERKILEACRAQDPESVNSILADRVAGRPMEIDARNGAIVRKGQKHGIPTPANKMVVALLQAIGD